MIENNQQSLIVVEEKEWEFTKCDKYDYMIATFSGGIAGLIDVFFIGDPLTSVLGKSVDKVADSLVKKAAQFFWNNDKRSTGKSKTKPQTLEQCISYLEQAFPVDYDARYASDLNVVDGVLSGMRPSNHHLLSLSHSPDPIGLIFSIIDQFRGCVTFIDKGQIIHVIPKKTSGAIPYMQGTDLLSMLFCGFVNWIGHLLSDLVGSSSTRRAGKTGRGSGISIPFYELFLMCDFGNIDGNTLAETMIKVFEEGYDLRFGATMAIPIILEELMIKAIWMIRQKLIRQKSWKESFPTMKHADLRIMLIVGNATLCVVDGVDAAIHGFTQGNVISFICHLNLIGWARLVLLIFKELSIRVGPIISQITKAFFKSVIENLIPNEREKIRALKEYLDQFETYLTTMFIEFVRQIEKEYEALYLAIDATFDKKLDSSTKAQNSIHLAEISGVDESKIIKNEEDFDAFFLD